MIAKKNRTNKKTGANNSNSNNNKAPVIAAASSSPVSISRSAIQKILNEALPDLNDEDWVLFLIEQIEDNLEVIKDAQQLNELIGDCLVSLIDDGDSLHIITGVIYTRLKEEKLIGADEEGEDEKQEERDGEEEEDGGSFGEGCCLLCEREMPLTKHHVIPKEVHEWYRKHHGMTKEKLHQGILICRACHSAIHGMYDNKTLASDYSTIEKLRDSEKVQKWLTYIRRKRPISKGDYRTLKPNGPRDLPPVDDDD